MSAWVANRIRGCLPPRTGCGCAATSSPRNALSRPVGIAVLPRGERGVQGRHQPLHVPAGARRDVDPRRPRHLDEVPLDLALEVEPALLVEQVPLVVGDDQGPAGLDHHRDDAGVLLGQRLAGVDQHDGDLGPVQGRLGAQGRVVVGAAGLLGAAADARGVDEPPRRGRRASTISSTGSRVVPATESTTTRSSPTTWLSSDDLPTLGRPSSATRRGPCSSSKRSSGVSGSAARTASSRSPLPRPCSAETG